MPVIKIALTAPRKNDLPFSPYLNLYLDQFFRDNLQRVLLSPNLMTEQEIDESIHNLLLQLEDARKKAKSQLKKAKARK